LKLSYSFLIASSLLACKADPSTDSGQTDSGGTDSGGTDSGEIAPEPRLIELGPAETLSSELINVLHIAALPDGSVVVSEAQAPPETRGRLALVSPTGDVSTLVADVPVVAFDHGTEYMGPDGITLLPDQETLIWSLFLGAGDIHPVEDDPDWDPEAGSIIYEVPLTDSNGDQAPTKSLADLTVWTQSKNSFVYDLAWQDPDTLWATEPGKNSIYVYSSEGEREATAWPLEKIAIEPVQGQESVEAVPTGLTLFQDQPVVAQLGGGITEADGVTPTGERYDQLVGRVSRFTGQGFEHIATGLPSVLDIVSVGDSMILACFDFYNSTSPEGSLIQLMPDGTSHVLETFQYFPNSIAVSGDQLYLMNASGNLLKFSMTFSEAAE
jgi:hypothetical protein